MGCWSRCWCNLFHGSSGRASLLVKNFGQSRLLVGRLDDTYFFGMLFQVLGLEPPLTLLCFQPFTWALIGLELGWVSAGLGRHIWAPNVHPQLGLIILFASEVVYDTSITIIRMSVLLFYHRIFGKDNRFRIALWITMAILVAWYIAITALAVFQCSPVQKQFDYTIPGHCLSFYGTFIGVTAPNFFIDVVLLLLPVPMLWKLKIKKTKKFALTANFLLGYWLVMGQTVFQRTC